MKRVLEIVLNGEGTIGGEQRHVLHVLDGLDRDRFTPEVVTWDIPAFVDELAARGVPTVAVVSERVLDLALLRRLEVIVRDGGFDLVHAHGHRAGALGRLAAVRGGAPHVAWTCHAAGNKADRTPLLRWGYHRALRYLDARTDVTIAVSPLMRDWLLSLGADPSRVLVIPNGVDCSVFTPGRRDERLLEGLGLDPRMPVVGTVGRLSEQKGIETLIRAAALVASDVPGAQFLIVGSGPLAEQLEALARELGPRNVVFAGERRDIPVLLRVLDVAIVPSFAEGAFCYGMLEAMASGTPVVCSDIPMFSDVVESGREALLFRVGDPLDLAASIVRLLSDRDEADRVASAGMRLVRERFSVERLQEETVRV